LRFATAFITAFFVGVLMTSASGCALSYNLSFEDEDDVDAIVEQVRAETKCEHVVAKEVEWHPVDAYANAESDGDYYVIEGCGQLWYYKCLDSDCRRIGGRDLPKPALSAD